MGAAWAGGASRRHTEIRASHVLTRLVWLEYDNEYSCPWLVYLC